MLQELYCDDSVADIISDDYVPCSVSESELSGTRFPVS